MIFNKKINIYALTCFIFFSAFSLTGHDVLLELKGAAFIPTSEVFQDIYGSAGEFGLELTAGSLCKHLYAFTSVDFLIKSGETVALESPTTVTIVDLAFGLKYFVPFSHGDFYLGLGVKPTYLSTKNQMTLDFKETQWSCGGVAKVGAIFNMPHSFFADIFFDYSFVNFDAGAEVSDQGDATAVNGCLFGVGFGYRFN